MSIRVLWLAAAVLLLATISYAQTPSPAAGRVRGTVSDSNTAVVPKAKVIFSAAGTTHETITDEEGRYEIELPIGFYRVTTEVNGFCRFQRAPFRVQSSSEALINLTLTVLQFDEKGQFGGEHGSYRDPLENDVLPLTKISNGPQGELVIRYGKRQDVKGLVEYGGGEATNGVPSGVTVTYDVLTMRADRVRLNKRSLRLEAEGNVKIEDGKQAAYYASAEIDLKASDPRITLIGRQ